MNKLVSLKQVKIENDNVIIGIDLATDVPVEEIRMNKKVSYTEPFSRRIVTGVVVMITEVLDCNEKQLVGEKLYYVSESEEYIPRAVFRKELTLIG